MSSTKDKSFRLDQLELGKPTEYADAYDSSLLQAVPRSLNRSDLGVVAPLPFYGEDVWHGYELSWLNAKGMPVVALMRCTVPCDSPNIIESKSFKLYLNSFNQTRFNSQNDVIEKLVADTSRVAEGRVAIELFGPSDTFALPATELPGDCLDELDLEVSAYDFDPQLLVLNDPLDSRIVRETLHSHLLKSNCLITNQPDWASVVIEYCGAPISHEGLLRYLISFRQHNEFHEQCVERIFVDLMNRYSFQELSVQALYTRRGGLDINPYRSTKGGAAAPCRRINRQ